MLKSGAKLSPFQLKNHFYCNKDCEKLDTRYEMRDTGFIFSRISYLRFKISLTFLHFGSECFLKVV